MRIRIVNGKLVLEIPAGTHLRRGRECVFVTRLEIGKIEDRPVS